MTTPSALIARWQQLRAELTELERAEHPDLTDRFGRVWVWRGRDLYVHDDLLAFPRSAIESPTLGLPRVGLVDENPNYAGLCAICRGGPPPLIQHR